MQVSRSALADKYEELYAKTRYGVYANSSHKLMLNGVATLIKNDVESILEVGCGRGIVLHAFQEHLFEVSGTEICPCLLRGELAKNKVFQLFVHEMDVIGDKAYDFVCSVNVLDHLPSVDDAILLLKEKIRIARRGIGLIVNGTPGELQTICEDRQWWVKTVYESAKSETFKYSLFQGGVDIVYRKQGGLRLFCWFI